MTAVIASSLVTPFNVFAQKVAGVFGVRWGSGQKDKQLSSAEMLDQIYTGGEDAWFLKGHGPQIPMNVLGTVTDAIPGSVYDTGIPAPMSWLPDWMTGKRGAAATTTTDISADPYAQAPAQPSLVDRGKQWLDSVTPSSWMTPGVRVDKAPQPTDNALPAATILAVGAVAAVGLYALSKKRG